MKYKTEFIIKRNESLAKLRIKTDTSRLLFKNKHENDIHENTER